jgi:hypothetical protein
MRGRKRFFCASVPKASSTGAHIDRPKGMSGGLPAKPSSSSKM